MKKSFASAALATTKQINTVRKASSTVLLQMHNDELRKTPAQTEAANQLTINKFSPHK